jgi:molecular chaperone DnaK (HSP70)
MLLRDVTPVSLGFGTEENCRVMKVVIPKNTTIPTKKSTNVTTLYDNQINVRFPVYEGESASTTDNYLLGEFYLRGIPPSTQGRTQYESHFQHRRERSSECVSEA